MLKWPQLNMEHSFMTIDIYQIDTFTKELFAGNPAIVCPLKEWIDDKLLQKIASENSVNETAFFVKREDGYHIRWFSPTKEVELCGHATLASAYVIFRFLEPSLKEVTFHSKSGTLYVRDEGEKLALDFPAVMPSLAEYSPIFNIALGLEPLKILKGIDYILVYENEKVVKEIEPQLNALINLDARGICLTARGEQNDFVFRYFTPRLGLYEDFVTASVCSQLIPLWSKILEKKNLTAKQIASREGCIECEADEKRITIRSDVVLYMKGTIYLPMKEEKRLYAKAG
ncbi:MAG: hypothetical protein B6D59_06840 [Campylobacteraceae bacterium 4484_4]|nr:MAG: hypothetical protein B6D59_06840 [Campylobacteraceae bacterium 4484_4]